MRDAQGHWLKGTSGNPKGRPTSKREEWYWSIMQNTVSFADWRKIIKKAVTQAIAGDRYARQFLADRLLGKDPVVLDIAPAVDEAFSTALEKVYGPVSENEPD